MLSDKEIDATCEINAYRLYELLMIESEYFALFNNGVMDWEHYGESLAKYAMANDYNIFGKAQIPKEVIGDFKKLADWESTYIVRKYLKGDDKDEN